MLALLQIPSESFKQGHNSYQSNKQKKAVFTFSYFCHNHICVFHCFYYFSVRVCFHIWSKFSFWIWVTAHSSRVLMLAKQLVLYWELASKSTDCNQTHFWCKCWLHSQALLHSMIHTDSSQLADYYSATARLHFILATAGSTCLVVFHPSHANTILCPSAKPKLLSQ